MAARRRPLDPLPKVPTGIAGLDAVTRGGLPRDQTTLIAGGPGTGKTLLALQSLVHGARDQDEPGLFVGFEEPVDRLMANAASFGWDLPSLTPKRLHLQDARVSPDAVRSGTFDLLGMLSGLQAQAEAMGARRIVFDGVDLLLHLLQDSAAARRELFRLQEWTRALGLTCILTAKAGPEADLTLRDDWLLDYLCDCVIHLRHCAAEGVSSRSLRVLKYRGSGFSENSFPLLIGRRGLEVANGSESGVEFPAYSERVPTGVGRLDTMLQGGYYRGSSVLVSGLPGTAKSTLAAAFIAETCRQGGRAVYVSFDEAASEIVRNMQSLGLDLAPHIKKGRLVMRTFRSELASPEEHLMAITALCEDIAPAALVVDPVSALAKARPSVGVLSVMPRLVRFCKSRGITTILTSLLESVGVDVEGTPSDISTIADTWIHLSNVVHGGERNRTLTIVKSRGTAHSNQVRELRIQHGGVQLIDVYTSGGDVLLGTARWEKEEADRIGAAEREAEFERRCRALEHTVAETEARMALMQLEAQTAKSELAALQAERHRAVHEKDAHRAGIKRQRTGTPGQPNSGRNRREPRAE